MAIRLKKTKTAKEVDDAFWLRHQFYVKEEGYFSSIENEYLTDHFDSHPCCANILAYEGDEPVGTLRINVDTGTGLPVDEYYDFSLHRKKIADQWESDVGEQPRIGCAGMLAIRKPWRNRRDVIRALFKMGATIGYSSGVTHIIATVNIKSKTMYRRIGFEALEEKVWIEKIGEYIVPMACPFEAYYKWAMEGLLESSKLLDMFSSHFQWLVLSPGEVVFDQGDEANEAYIIDSGVVSIVRKYNHDKKEVMLASLGHGELFGEMSLIEAKSRSAKAVAMSNTELVSLGRDDFLAFLYKQPARMADIMQRISGRLRHATELVGMLISGTAQQRLEFACNDLYHLAVPDVGQTGTYVTMIDATEFVRNAGVSEEEGRQVLDAKVNENIIEYSRRKIRFLKQL